jgi:hypothetical protein
MPAESATFTFALNRAKLRQVRRREGRYLLRTSLCGKDPAELWRFYIQLVEIEAAFKNPRCAWPHRRFPTWSAPPFGVYTCAGGASRHGEYGEEARQRGRRQHPPSKILWAES